MTREIRAKLRKAVEENDVPQVQNILNRHRDAVNIRYYISYQLEKLNKELIANDLQPNQGLDDEDYKDGYTPLLHATKLNRIDIINFLLSINANVIAPVLIEGKIYSVLDIAIRERHWELSKLLILQGIIERNIYYINDIASSNREVAQLLFTELTISRASMLPTPDGVSNRLINVLNQGINVNLSFNEISARFGDTILTYVARNAYFKSIEQLITRFGNHVDIQKLVNGEKAWKIAKESGHFSIVKILFFSENNKLFLKQNLYNLAYLQELKEFLKYISVEAKDDDSVNQFWKLIITSFSENSIIEVGNRKLLLFMQLVSNALNEGQPLEDLQTIECIKPMLNLIEKLLVFHGIAGRNKSTIEQGIQLLNYQSWHETLIEQAKMSLSSTNHQLLAEMVIQHNLTIKISEHHILINEQLVEIPGSDLESKLSFVDKLMREISTQYKTQGKFPTAFEHYKILSNIDKWQLEIIKIDEERNPNSSKYFLVLKKENIFRIGETRIYKIAPNLETTNSVLTFPKDTNPVNSHFRKMLEIKIDQQEALLGTLYSHQILNLDTIAVVLRISLGDKFASSINLQEWQQTELIEYYQLMGRNENEEEQRFLNIFVLRKQQKFESNILEFKQSLTRIKADHSILSELVSKMLAEASELQTEVRETTGGLSYRVTDLENSQSIYKIELEQSLKQYCDQLIRGLTNHPDQNAAIWDAIKNLEVSKNNLLEKFAKIQPLISILADNTELLAKYEQTLLDINTKLDKQDQKLLAIDIIKSDLTTYKARTQELESQIMNQEESIEILISSDLIEQNKQELIELKTDAAERQHVLESILKTIDEHGSQLKPLLVEMKNQQAQERLLSSIYKDPYENAFYNYLVQQLNAVWLASAVVNTDIVACQKSGIISDIGNAVKLIATYVPFVGIAVQLCGALLIKLDNKIQQEKISNFFHLVRSPVVMDNVAREVAIALLKDIDQLNIAKLEQPQTLADKLYNIFGIVVRNIEEIVNFAESDNQSREITLLTQGGKALLSSARGALQQVLDSNRQESIRSLLFNKGKKHAGIIATIMIAKIYNGEASAARDVNTEKEKSMILEELVMDEYGLIREDVSRQAKKIATAIVNAGKDMYSVQESKHEDRDSKFIDTTSEILKSKVYYRNLLQKTFGDTTLQANTIALLTDKFYRSNTVFKTSGEGENKKFGINDKIEKKPISFTEDLQNMISEILYSDDFRSIVNEDYMDIGLIDKKFSDTSLIDDQKSDMPDIDHLSLQSISSRINLAQEIAEGVLNHAKFFLNEEKSTDIRLEQFFVDELTKRLGMGHTTLLEVSMKSKYLKSDLINKLALAFISSNKLCVIDGKISIKESLKINSKEFLNPQILQVKEELRDDGEKYYDYNTGEELTILYVSGIEYHSKNLILYQEELLYQAGQIGGIEAINQLIDLGKDQDIAVALVDSARKYSTKQVIQILFAKDTSQTQFPQDSLVPLLPINTKPNKPACENDNSAHSMPLMIEDNPYIKPQLSAETSINFYDLLYKSTISLKGLDFMVDTFRFVNQPNTENVQKILRDVIHMQSILGGNNMYSMALSFIDITNQLAKGDVQEAGIQAITTISYMVLPTMLSFTGIPYLGFAYGGLMAGYSGYYAANNARSLYSEYGTVEWQLKSAVAYKNLYDALSNSPLQHTYDFASNAKWYEIKINSIKLEIEKTQIKQKLEPKGEFGNKLYDYIHNPILEEKYSLLNKVISGELTEDQAAAMKAKHIALTIGAQHYEHCMEVKNDVTIITTEQYYCYNESQQILDHIAITGGSSIEIMERL